jgi:hypothetical protein
MAEQVAPGKADMQNNTIHIPAPTAIPIYTSPSVPPGSEDYLHELRVRIPVDLHRQLLSLKVLRGKSLAETVSTALDIYFQEHAKKASESNE